MLSRDELTSNILPVIVSKDMTNNSNNSYHQKHHSSERNIIKKALLRNKEVNLFLPLPKSIISSFHKEREHEQSKFSQICNTQINDITNHTHDKIVFPIMHKKPIKSKQLDALNECHSKDYIDLKARFKETKDKLNKFKCEKPKEKEGNQPFNLRALVNKVKMITDSVKLNMKLKMDIQSNYRVHAISKKKDSKQIEEYLRLEKSIENIYLQKVILNVEYDNIVNKHRKPNHHLSSMRYKTSYWLTEENSAANRSIEQSLNSSKKIKETAMQASRAQSMNKESLLITEMKKQYKDRYSFNQKYFLEKYEKCLNQIKHEEKEHIEKKIFSAEEIDSIMKSKKDIVLDNLKNEYVIKYNEHLDLKKKSLEEPGSYREKILKNKEKTQKRIGSKMFQAIAFSEQGNMDNVRYQLKDYIKDINYSLFST